MTLRALRLATVLSRDCCADFGRALTKKVMSHSRDGPGFTAPLRTNIVPLSAVWNPPLPLPPVKKSPKSARRILTKTSRIPLGHGRHTFKSWMSASRACYSRISGACPKLAPPNDPRMSTCKDIRRKIPLRSFFVSHLCFLLTKKRSGPKVSQRNCATKIVLNFR